MNRSYESAPTRSTLPSWLGSLAPLLLALLAASACASSGTTGTDAAHPAGAGAGASTGPAVLAGPPALPARVLAELPEGTELRVARRGTRGVLMLRQGGRWWAGAFDAVGDVTARSSAAARTAKEPESLVDIAPAPEDPALAAVQAVGEGYLAAWVAAPQGKPEVRAVALDERGHPTAQPTLVSALSERARWVDLVPMGAKALVLVEVEGAGSRELLAAPWQPRGGTSLKPVARAVGGWQSAWHGEHAALATVVSIAGETGLGQPVVSLLGSDGSVSATVTLGTQRTARADIQVVVLRDRVLAAWTDVRPAPGLANDGANDPHVWLAAVGFDGSLLVPPRPAVEPVGEHALAGLVASSDREQALLAWEAAAGGGASRSIQLALLRADGSRGDDQTELSFEATSGWPQVAASASGYTAVTLASAQLDAASGASSSSPVDGVVPTMVRLGTTLEVVASEPIRVAEFGEPGIPAWVRDLDCAGPSCSALASQGESKPLLALVDLPTRASPWAAAARHNTLRSGPRARGVGSVASGDQRFVEVAAARLADGRELGAWLGEAPAGADGSAGGATLGYRLLSDSAELGPPHVLSERALAAGGVDVEPTAAPAATGAGKARPPNKTIATVGWVAPNNGAPQVFLTQIGQDGKKLAQKTVTQLRAAKGAALELSDVDLASDVAGNTVVAWTDTRDGNPEIYAVKVGPTLEKSAAEQRITQAEGSSTEVRIAITPERTFLVWSDAREQADRGAADIYLAKLDTKTLKKLGPEQRLAESDTHSRTPGIVVSGDGLVVWWLEEATPGGDASGSGLRVLRLDAKGDPLGSPLWLSAGPRSPITSATVGCNGATCRAALAWVDGPTLRLGALALPATEQGGSRELRASLVPLMSLAGGNWQDVSLGAADGSVTALWFVGPRAESASSVRRLVLGW